MNHLAQEAYETALKRKQITKDNTFMHGKSYVAILSELEEYDLASELTKSGHLPQYTEAEEELTDILIVCLTELHRRGTNIEEIVKAKIEFNKTRL